VSSDLGWRADGMARALAAGGIELEIYRRPGFITGTAVRRSLVGASGSGIPIEAPGEADPTPDKYERWKTP